MVRALASHLCSPGSKPGVDAICGLSFRAEKRSAQASAHPLSQAQGGLFCDCVCLLVCH